MIVFSWEQPRTRRCLLSSWITSEDIETDLQSRGCLSLFGLLAGRLCRRRKLLFSDPSNFSPFCAAVLPPDLLSGHRQRFNKLFTALKQFYAKSANLQYFKTLIQVPQLPDVSHPAARCAKKLVFYGQFAYVDFFIFLSYRNILIIYDIFFRIYVSFLSYSFLLVSRQ